MASAFSGKITADGSSGFPAAAGRYHLYVSRGCPFAHRTLMGRMLKGLESIVSVDITHPVKKGIFFFDATKDGCTPDTVNGCDNMEDIYKLADKHYAGKFSVPVLWDKETKTIVSNDSGDILLMFAKQFDAFCETEEQRKLDLYPDHLRENIDDICTWLQEHINFGVYTASLGSRTQEDYDKAVNNVFVHLDKAEALLSQHRYLTGDQLTVADIRLFTSLLRFDTVYYILFKCNKRRVVDYPNLWGFLRDVYQMPGVVGTIRMDHIKEGYFLGMLNLNPSGIVPVGPDMDLTLRHDRQHLRQAGMIQRILSYAMHLW